MNEQNELLEPIAIVGMGGIFPGSLDIPSYWSNVLNKVDSIIEVPADRWDWKLYYDPDHSAPDKTYSKIGGFVRDFQFDPLKLRIPPPVALQMDNVQKMAVAATAEALRDAGYDKKPYDPERTAVILGNSMGGAKKEATDMRVYYAFYQDRLACSASFSKLPASTRKTILAEMERGVKAKMGTITEDTMPGELSNVIAGRVANVFNFNGANFTVDAACASSLAALDQAVHGLRALEYDMVFCGGVDQMMTPPAYVKFCKIGALSPDGSRPFDAGANGFVMGEGGGVLALKRLSDALRDNDRIYGLIRAVGSSSDGRGKGITAPNPKGQRLAMERTFKQLDYTPGDVGLLEAHGTSTKVGDVVEVTAVSDLFRHYVPLAGMVGLGSVKSQIGHLKAAAGIASLVKTALALHHKTLPPSINFHTPNPGIDWKHCPFFVVTDPREWKPLAGRPRRAGVSSFGFGGTNFHVALEEVTPGTIARWEHAAAAARSRPSVPPPPSTPSYSAPSGFDKTDSLSPIELPPAAMNLNPALIGEAFLIHGATPDAVFDRLQALLAKIPPSGRPLAPLAHSVNTHARRGEYSLCLAAESGEKLKEKIDFILRAKSPALWDKTSPLFRTKGIYLGRRKKPGKIGFLFPGQGSQYVDMLKDLREKYRIVAEAFDEADKVMKEAAGYRLTEVLFTEGGESPEQIARMEERIKRTEITQPAVLTADVAILRLLRSYGVEPDMVCGHSLGEYGALVAAGVLSFKEALLAVSARGKEMAGVKVKDNGKMASIAAPVEKVESVLKEVKGYVAPANKNCPIQTVIAGESHAVEAAIKKFMALGIQAQEIAVSHAFHSKIVEPAQIPYARFLERLPVQPPQIPVLSNVTAAYYPKDAKGIRALMVSQIASSVEFIRQLDRMYKDGVRLFVEVGPKRALTAFVTSTLEKSPGAVPMSSNHPKRGGILEFNDLLAHLEAEGVQLDLENKNPDATDLFAPEFAARLQTSATSRPVRLAATGTAAEPSTRTPADRERNGAGPATSGIATEVSSKTLMGRGRGAMPDIAGPTATASEATNDLQRSWGFYTGPVVVSGIAAGTPGAWDRVFREGNIDDILRGQNLIGKLTDDDLQRQIDKNIVRLIKSPTGDHRLERIESAAEVVQLAGIAGEFDLAKEFGFKESIANAMDISSKLAVAAGLLALKDAGIPLISTYKETTTSSSLHTGWKLPPALREETGVIFATSYPSIDSMASEVSRFLSDKYRHKPLRELASLMESLISRLKDPDDRAAVQSWYASNFRAYQERYGDQGPYEFSRDFLLRVMPLGHTQLAQWIGAKGPGAQISAACASTTQAVAMAEDWLRLGRAKRVVVIAGDDVTSPNLREWIVTGFLTAGAATTAGVVSEAALPFDKRRHGMILGMGAAGLVVEQGALVAERGMRPLTEILATQFENSAFHATRLHIEHVGEVMERLLAKAEQRWGLDRRQIAAKALFMSHETYTPARGGSASAEVNALRRAFGPDAGRIIVANTKGLTGHSMGASIEDPVAIRALVTGIVPPIANYKVPDPDLAGITLSRGGEYDLEYAIRLGAGFGSQIAMTLMRRVLKKGENRISDPQRHRDWLSDASGVKGAELEVLHSTLRVRDSHLASPSAAPYAPASAPAPIAPPMPATPVPTPAFSASPTVAAATPGASLAARPDPARTHPAPVPGEATSEADVRETVVRVVSEKTGYPAEMLELDLDMEADLGIDTVKQAEMFGMLREKYSIPKQENLALKDYPTLRHLIRFIMESRGGAAGATTSTEDSPTTAADMKVNRGGSASTDMTRVAETAASASSVSGMSADFRRWALEAYERPASGSSKALAKDRTALILADDSAAAKPFVDAFKKWNVSAAAVTVSPWKDSAEAEKILRKAAGGKKIQGIVYAPGLSLPDFDAKDRAAFDALYRKAVRPLFLAAKIFRTELDAEGGWLLVLTRMTGAHGAPQVGAKSSASSGKAGPSGKSFHPMMGALTGLAKALRKELPKARVVSLDVDPAQSIKEAAESALSELRRGDGQVEVGCRCGKRWAVRLVPRPAAGKTVTLTAASTVLVTGGGQGLGAECAKEIARRWRCKLVILGRTPLEAKTGEWAKLDAKGMEVLKKNMWENLKADKTRKATPAILEREFSKITKAAALRKNLDAMKNAGAEPIYIAADIADAGAVAKAVKTRKIKPDVILHAAGLEESKLLADKTQERFDAVFQTKAHGAMNLLAAIAPKPCQTWIFFSSVVGRFGNIGQTDYAAASDCLPKLAAALSRTGPRAVAVDLPAIADIGMATRGGVEFFLKSQGVDFMPPATAVRMILEELLHPAPETEVLLAARLGRIDPDGQMQYEPDVLTDSTRERDKMHPAAPSIKKNPLQSVAQPKAKARMRLPSKSPAVVAETNDELPAALKTVPGKVLIDRILKQADSEIVTGKEFSLASDPWLKDHAIAGTPYVAGVMGLELFAETSARLLGRLPCGFSDVRFSLPIKLLREKPIAVRTYCALAAPGAVRKEHFLSHGAGRIYPPGAESADLRIESDFVTPQGIKLGAPRVHFTAKSLRSDVNSRWIEIQKPALNGTQNPVVKPNAIYSAYFHGPSFQVLSGILSLSESELLAACREPDKPLWPETKTLVFRPMLIEAAFQACGYRDLHFTKKMTLPDSIGQVLVHGRPEENPEGPAYIYVRHKGTDQDGKSVYDAFAIDKNYRIWVELRDYKMIPIS